MRSSSGTERASSYGSKDAYSDPSVYEKYDEVRFTSLAGRLFDKREKQMLLEAVPEDRGARILECGTGTGRFAAELARRGYSVVATDVSPGMLDLARRRIEAEGLGDRVHVQYGDIYHLDFPDGSFDFVYAIRVLNQLARNEDKRRAVAEMVRVLAPGGRILFDVVNLWSLAVLRKASWHTSPRDMARTLRRAGCRVDRVRGALLFTQTLLELLPGPLARLLDLLDRGACRLLPIFATRVYLVARRV